MGNSPPTIPPNPPSDDPQKELLHEGEAATDENPLSTCEICMEPMTISEKQFRNGDDCAHPFCTDCIVKYIRVKLEDYNTGKIKCPASGCDSLLDPLACAELAGKSLFVRWCDALCEAAIVDLDVCYCPYRECNVLIVNECGGRVRKASCPMCNRWFCFRCKGFWHAASGCDMSGELRDLNDAKMVRLAGQMQWMRCPRCRHFVERSHGCKIVRCRCGIDFCYKCGEQVHQHWCGKCGKNFLRNCGEFLIRLALVGLIVVLFIILIRFISCSFLGFV